MPRQTKTLDEQIRAAKLRVLELEEDYKTQLYFETMPEYDPTYAYCYSTSSRSLSYEDQSVDAWLRAVIKHLGNRRPGHGGAYTDAVVVSTPAVKTDSGVELWLEYITKQLRAKAKARKKLTDNNLDIKNAK